MRANMVDVLVLEPRLGSTSLGDIQHGPAYAFRGGQVVRTPDT